MCVIIWSSLKTKRIFIFFYCWPDLFCFLFGLLTAEGNSAWLARPLLVPFLSRQLSESLPFPTPSRLLDRDKASGEPWEGKKEISSAIHINTEHKHLSTNVNYKVNKRNSIIYTVWVNVKDMSDLICGGHAGFVWDMIGSPELLDGLSWHGLWEAETTPGVGRGAHLSHYWLL